MSENPDNDHSTSETKFNFMEDGWNANTLDRYSHCGTRIDVSIHIEAGSGRLDDRRRGDGTFHGDGFAGEARRYSAENPLFTMGDFGALPRGLHPGKS